MKFQNVVVGAAIAASAMAQKAGGSPADDNVFDDLLGKQAGDAKEAKEEQPSKSETAVQRPPFAPFQAMQAAFWDQFENLDQWKESHAKKNDEFSYVGKWAIEEPKVFPGFAGDTGLVLKSPAAHHAISAKLSEPFDNTDNTLVLQYEVKLQKGLECGGAYIKLLSENKELHAEEFSNASPYQIMFGPDKCGTTNKVHFIVRRKSPKTGEYEEKHLSAPPPARLNKLTNLYTLVIRPDQTYDIRINGDVVKAGSLTAPGTFRPALNPPETIEDPNDTKPADWVDDPTMPDPDQATKPDDWDEDAPFQIPDPDATKPDDWLENEPPYIPDPEAELPEDWDEEEDGEWVAPEIPNPACEDVSGCGPWEAPLVPNPAYKGKWVQPRIDNPDYKGEWAPRQIPNPDYYEDTKPADLEPIGALGFELWTMQSDIVFDNVYLGHSIEEAETIGNTTFLPKLEVERAQEKETVPKDTKKPKERKVYDSAMDYFKDDPIGYVTEVARVFILNFSADPATAVKTNPNVAAAFAAAIVFGISILFGVLNTIRFVLFSSGKPAPAAAAAKKTEAADKAPAKDSATASGVANGTAGPVKRKA